MVIAFVEYNKNVSALGNISELKPRDSPYKEFIRRSVLKWLRMLNTN